MTIQLDKYLEPDYSLEGAKRQLARTRDPKAKVMLAKAIREAEGKGKETNDPDPNNSQ